MADVTTTTRTLNIDLMFVDEDTRLIKLPNPKETLQASDITTLETLIRTNNLIVGDKTGAAFGKISTAKNVEVMRTDYDLT